jgi:hypothetical protein
MQRAACRPFRSTGAAAIMRAEELRMDKALVEMLARAAGLDKALADYPADVFGAAEQALNTANAIRYPTDPAAEPWPPMRAESQA